MSLLRYRENSLVCSFKDLWLKMTGSPKYVPAWQIIWFGLDLGGLPGPFCLSSHHWAESVLHFGDVRVASPQVMPMGQHRESGEFGHKFCPHLVQPTVGTRLIRARKYKHCETTQQKDTQRLLAWCVQVRWLAACLNLQPSASGGLSYRRALSTGLRPM